MFGVKSSREKELEKENEYLAESLVNCEEALDEWIIYAEGLNNEVQELKNEIARLKILNNNLKNKK
ncbi:hypothetical protein [Lactococcus formosensis]|uniref:hypothetical protein n=1 Tax=Lactococcus formosensis TaxID=1281486 RepID=UPI001BCACC1F|nr:hypothetical protein [Lactococcus formosensis]